MKTGTRGTDVTTGIAPGPTRHPALVADQDRILAAIYQADKLKQNLRRLHRGWSHYWDSRGRVISERRP